MLVDRPLAAQLLQAGPAGPHGLELAAVPVAQGGQERVQAGLGLGHHAQQALDGGGVGLQPGPALGRLLALLGVPGQPALDLAQALGQDPAALDQSGGAHLPLVAGGRGLGQPRLDAPALLAGAGHAAGGLDPLVLQRGHAGHQLGHPGGVAADAVLELGPVAPDLLQLGGQQVPVARDALASHAGRLVGDLVAVVGPDRLGRRLSGGLHLGPCGLPLLGGTPGLALGHLGPVAGLLDDRGRDHAAAGPHAPARRREPVAVPGDHDQVRTGQRQVDRLGPATGGTARAVEQRVEHAVEAGELPAAGTRPDVAADRLGPRGHGRAGQHGAAGGGPGQGQDRAGGTPLAEAGQCGAGRLAAGDDHGGQRRAGGGLEGLLPPAVHLDQVEQRPDDAVDAGQQLGTGRSPGLVEGPLERVGPGLGAGVLLLRLAEGLLGHLEAAAGGHLGGLGLGPRRLEAVTALLGLGQALAQLVVLALQDRGATLGGALPGHQLVEGTAVALQGVLEGRELAPGHR